MPGSGRLSEVDFARLTCRAKEGWIKRSDVGSFIVENLVKDPKSKVFGKSTITLLTGDLLAFVQTIGPALLAKIFGSDEDMRKGYQNLEEKLTKLLGEDNPVRSAGEFGLFFAFFANKPGAKEIDGEPAVFCADHCQARLYRSS